MFYLQQNEIHYSKDLNVSGLMQLKFNGLKLS